MKKLMLSLALAALLFGCIAWQSAPSQPASQCSGRYEERLQRCVEVSDSVFSSASQYSGKYVCLWGTLASQTLLTMPSAQGGRVQIHLSWGINAPPAIGECANALANVCGTFSSASGETYYQLLDAQTIGLDTERCIDTPPAPPETQMGGIDSPPAPPQQNSSTNATRREIQGGGTSPPGNPPSQPPIPSDMPPEPPA